MNSYSAIPEYISKKFLANPKIKDLNLKPEAITSIYALLGITEEVADSSNVRVIDQAPDDRLYLFHYFEPKDVAVWKVRGTIIHITDEEEPVIISKSFPYTEVFIAKDNSITDATETSDLKFDVESCIVSRAYEGTVIRIFKGPITSKIYIASHKKIDCRRSRWSGPTFGFIFDELWGDVNIEDYTTPGESYILLLSHPENKLVCNLKKPKLRLVAKYHPVTDTFLFCDSEDLKLTLPHPQVKKVAVLSAVSNSDIIEQLKKEDCSKNPGIFIYNKKDNTCCKVVKKEYFEKLDLRGCEPNLKLKYLQYKMEDTERFRDFCSLFSEKKDLFDEIEKDYNKIPDYLYYLYRKRYFKKDSSIIGKEEHVNLEKTRRGYDKSISLRENLVKTLKTNTGRQVNAMIKRMKKEIETAEI